MSTKEIIIQEVDDYVVVKPLFDLLDRDVEQFKTSLNTVIDESAKNIVLDFENVNYMSSRAIGTIVRVYKTLKEAEKYFGVIHVSDEMSTLLMSINLHKVLPSFPTLEEYTLWIHQSDTGDTENCDNLYCEFKKFNDSIQVNISGIEKPPHSVLFHNFLHDTENIKKYEHIYINFKGISKLNEELLTLLNNYITLLNCEFKIVSFINVNDELQNIFSIFGIEP